jgi:glutaminase
MQPSINKHRNDVLIRSLTDVDPHDRKDLQATLDALVATTMLQTDRGTVADYIPALGRVDPKKFGVAIACTDGRLFESGDAAEPFSIQSVSKVFTLAMAIGAVGDGIWHRVGHKPSSESFNSIVELEREEGIPRNPFINAGALVVADILLASHEPREAIGEILRFVRFLADDDSIVVDRRVARSERQIDYRNAGLANYLAAFKNLRNCPERVLGVYAHHCAISMNCKQLAIAGRFLANAGRNPQSGLQIVSTERSRRINALLLTCGQYDGSGEFAFHIGLPAKSGVGGGILAIVPSIASIAVWSPGLDQSGNSKLGCAALRRLTASQGWSVFGR